MEVLPILGQHFSNNVRKYVGIPNCWSIASTSYKNFFQYAGVPLTELINKNALSLAKNLSVTLWKLFLTIPTASAPGLILCIAKSIDERKWCCSYTDLAKKDIICIWWKVLIKVQQSFIKVPSRIYWNISRSITTKFTLRKKIRKCFLFKKINRLKLKLLFSCPEAIVKFSLLTIFGISETRVVSSDPVFAFSGDL